MTETAPRGIIDLRMARTVFRTAFLSAVLILSSVACLVAQSADAGTGSRPQESASPSTPVSPEESGGVGTDAQQGVPAPGERQDGGTAGQETADGVPVPFVSAQDAPESETPGRTAENLLSAYPFNILYGIFSVSYERKLNDLVSLEASPFFHTPIFGLNPAKGNPLLFFSWYGLRLGVLFYPGQTESDGLFTGVMIRPSSIALISGKLSTFSLGIGAMAGYRFNFGAFAVTPRVGFVYEIPFSPSFSGMNYSKFPFQWIMFEWDAALSWIF